MRKKDLFREFFHLSLMKTLMIFICSLFCLNAQALELEISSFVTYHFLEGNYNSNDDHTTFNPNIRLTHENTSLMLLKDSVGDYNLGLIHRLDFFESPVKIVIGAYLVNPKTWKQRKFKTAWADIPNTKFGIIPVLGPGVEIDLYKKDNFTIKAEGVFSIGLFTTGGLTLGWDF